MKLYLIIIKKEDTDTVKLVNLHSSLCFTYMMLVEFDLQI